MFSYQPPLKDIQFVLNKLLDAPTVLSQLPAFEEVDADLMQHVIEEAGRFSSEILFPLNAVGDREGVSFNNGEIKTPTGFAQAYRQFRDAGWTALHCDPEYGGQGLPQTLNTVLYEMLGSANHAWAMYPGLLHGAYACLHKHASDELKNTYLPKLVSGEWLATMCLTEPQAGSDLGLLRTRAVPQDDGSVRITGNKIFISGGEQDLTDNIVHLVLARLPDAPVGSKGISLFLVPKFIPSGEAEPQRNAVHCTGIEHKMGIHGSATCSMEFDNAVGWLVGEPHRGLASMFVMMNSARLQVGAQGIGTAEVAYQNSHAYAHERLQMRAPDRPAERRTEPADPIIMHPAVQRLLFTQKAYLEGGRMLSYWGAVQLDISDHHPDPEIRHRSHELLALITPIIKALATEQSFLGASSAVQIYGGHGYIAETGIEQYLRDSRITMIYEGTNEIQAVDLLLRKIIADEGQRLTVFFDEIKKTLTACTDDMADNAKLLAELCTDIGNYTAAIGKSMKTDPQLPYQLAPEIYRLMAHCALGWLWLRSTMCAAQSIDEDPTFYTSKISTANYYFNYVFAEVFQHRRVVETSLKASLEGRNTLRLNNVD